MSNLALTVHHSRFLSLFTFTCWGVCSEYGEFLRYEKPMNTAFSEQSLQALVEGTHGSPYEILGPHADSREGEEGTTVRAFLPYADQVSVGYGSKKHEVPMVRIHDAGLFECFVSSPKPLTYRLKITEHDGSRIDLEDPYRFPLLISDFDLHLHGEGTHYRTYEQMGAHVVTVEGIKGVHFAVWAPNALRVSVIGWFNRWNGLHHPLQKRGASGLWELFVPGLKEGDLYKYEIAGRNGYLNQKADPYAFASEVRPKTASMVYELHGYEWKDRVWLQRRRETDWLKKPISIYEVHLGSWKRVPEEGNRWLTYREAADQLLPYVKEQGFTHIELLPISEHPFDGSWGYQTIGYYSPTSRFGSPNDLKYFIDRCHQEEIGVLLDWVPAHFPKDAHGLAFFDGTHLYEHADPRQGEHIDWGTLIFNYGRNEVRSYLLSNAMYWADIFHIDGLRVDAVASMLYLDYSRKEGEWIPNEFGGRENLEAVDFLKKFNEILHADYPGILSCAEESTSWPMVSKPTYLGGLGFGLKWNMGWMNDTLEYFSKDPVHRKYHHNNITFSLIYAFTENFLLPFSHDEVVHGKNAMLTKMPGNDWERFANLRVLYAYMYAHPGKKLLFMGSEIGQWDEWDIEKSVDWHLLQWEPHRKVQGLVADLNALYKSSRSLYEIDFTWEGFEWIDFHDSDNSIISFLRRGTNAEDVTVCIFNFTPVRREGYRVGVPIPGLYAEVLNTDAEKYGGSDARNPEMLQTEQISWANMPHSLCFTLPPLGAVYLQPKHP